MRRNDPNEAYLTFAIWGGLAIFVVAALLIANYRRRKRREAFQRTAEELGLAFFSDGSPELLYNLRHFYLFTRGRSKKMLNLLRGQSGGREVAVFDYQFVTGSGKRRRTHHNTVVSLRFDGPDLPNFALRPEGLWDMVGGWFGGQDIDFGTRPDFSSRYLLRGDHEPAVRALFTDEVRDFYERNRGLGVEGMGQTLLYYRYGQRVSPDEVQSLLASALDVLSLYNRRYESG